MFIRTFSVFIIFFFYGELNDIFNSFFDSAYVFSGRSCAHRKYTVAHENLLNFKQSPQKILIGDPWYKRRYTPIYDIHTHCCTAKNISNAHYARVVLFIVYAIYFIYISYCVRAVVDLVHESIIHTYTRAHRIPPPESLARAGQ